MLLVAILTVYRPSSIWFKGNLTLLSAIGAGRIGHFSWASVEAVAAVSITCHIFHLPLYRLTEIDTAAKTSQQNFFESMQCDSLGNVTLSYISFGQSSSYVINNVGDNLSIF